jgi:hypothetical protein
MLQFYKPNPKNTGAACSFSYNKKDKAVWVNFVKQSGWNSDTRTGTFRGSGPDKKANSKFNMTEIAGLVHAIETAGEYSNYHGNKDRNTKFTFCPYLQNEKQVGYSFKLAQSNSADGTNKSFLIGFKFEESRLLKQYLLTVINNYSLESIEQSQQYKNSNEYNKAPSDYSKNLIPPQEKVEKVDSTMDNNQSGNTDDIPW